MKCQGFDRLTVDERNGSEDNEKFQGNELENVGVCNECES